MPGPLDELAHLGGAGAEPAINAQINPPMPGEMPADQRQRELREGEVQRTVQDRIRRVKAGDLARRDIPFYQDATGTPQAVTDAHGKPLQRFNPGQQVAYDSQGKPQRLNWDVDGPPTLSDPFQGTPVTTDPKTGQRVQKIPGLPPNKLDPDPDIAADYLEREAEKEVRQAATVLGRKLSITERAQKRDEVEFKARGKKLSETYGIDPENLDAAPQQIEAYFQAALESPEANSSAGWFSWDRSPEADAYRGTLEQKRQQALAQVAELQRLRGNITGRKAEIDPQRAQVDQIQGALADKEIARMREAGILPPESQGAPGAGEPHNLAVDGSTPSSATTPEGVPVTPIPGADKLPDVGFTDVFAHNPASRYVPFGNGIADVAEMVKIGNTFVKLKNPENDAYWTTPEGQQELAGAKEYVDWNSRDRTLGGTVAEILSELPSFAGELAATWGIYSAGAKTGQKVAKEILTKLLGDGAGELLNKKLAQLAIKGTGAAVGAAAQLPVAGGLRIAADTMQRMLPGVQISEDDAGKLSGVITGEGDDFGEALRKAVGNQYVELLSERTGAALAFLPFDKLAKIPGVDKLAQIKAGLVTKWLGDGKTIAGLQEALKRVGWNGVLGEMFEERVAGVMGGAGAAGEHLADGDPGAMKAFIEESIPSGKQLLAEAIAFSIPGAAIGGAKAVFGKKPGEPGAPAEPVTPDPTSPPPTATPPAGGIVPPSARPPTTPASGTSVAPPAAGTPAGAGTATPAPATDLDPILDESPEHLIGDEFSAKTKAQKQAADAWIEGLEPGDYEAIDANGDVIYGTVEVTKKKNGKSDAVIIGENGVNDFTGGELMWNTVTNADGSRVWERGVRLRKKSKAPTIDGAAQGGNKAPTQGQIDGGNAKLGKFRLGGMEIGIETAAGDIRRSHPDSPDKWEIQLSGAHYGRIRGAYSKDNELMDVFVAEGAPKDYDGPVHVVNQLKPDGTFDEHKVVIGAQSPAEAEALYSAQYNPGHARAESVATFSSAKAFRTWAKGATKRVAKAKGEGELWMNPDAPKNTSKAPEAAKAAISPHKPQSTDVSHVISTAIRLPNGKHAFGAKWNSPHKEIVPSAFAEDENWTGSEKDFGYIVQLPDGSQMFLERKPAQRVANQAGQIIPGTENTKGELNSQDLQPLSPQPPSAPESSGEPPVPGGGVKEEDIARVAEKVRQSYIAIPGIAISVGQIQNYLGNEFTGQQATAVHAELVRRGVIKSTNETQGPTPPPTTPDQTGGKEGAPGKSEKPETPEGDSGLVEKRAAERRKLIERTGKVLGFVATSETLAGGFSINSASHQASFNPERVIYLAEVADKQGGDGDAWIQAAFDEEVAHLRDLLASEGVGRGFAEHHTALWSHVPKEIKDLVDQVYGADFIDAAKAAELLRMLDQLARNNSITEDHIGGNRPVAELKKALAAWDTPADWEAHQMRMQDHIEGPKQKPAENQAPPAAPDNKKPEGKPDAPRPPPTADDDLRRRVMGPDKDAPQEEVIAALTKRLGELADSFPEENGGAHITGTWFEGGINYPRPGDAYIRARGIMVSAPLAELRKKGKTLTLQDVAVDKGKPAAKPPVSNDTKPKSFKYELEVDGKFSGNGIRYATKAEAEKAGREHMNRWMSVTDVRAVEAEEAPTHRWDDEKGAVELTAKPPLTPDKAPQPKPSDAPREVPKKKPIKGAIDLGDAGKGLDDILGDLGASDPSKDAKADRIAQLYAFIRETDQQRKANTDPAQKERYTKQIEEAKQAIQRLQGENLGASDPSVPAPSRKNRIAEIEQATRDLKAGKITRAERDEIVDRLKPVLPLTSIPPVPSEDRVREVVKSNMVDRVGKAKDIPAGTPVGLRMDIPAWQNHQEQVTVVHTPAKGASAGTVLAYEGMARVTNPRFNVGDQKKAQAIATGEITKLPGFTVEGQFDPSKDIPADLLKWTQVGFNPERHSFFYDKLTGLPVLSGKEAIAIGRTVFVKEPTFGNPETFLFASDPSAIVHKPLPKAKIAALVDYADTLVGLGVKTPETLAATIEARYGSNWRPYVRAIWNAMKSGSTEELPQGDVDWNGIYAAIDQPEKSAAVKLAEEVRDALRVGPLDRRALAELAKDSGLSTKEIDEAAELGIVMRGRELVDDGLKLTPGIGEEAATKRIFGELVSLYEAQPNLTAKTSDSKIRQAYSTPLPLAWMGANFTRSAKGKVMDSTAGNSAMLIGVKPENGVVNELDPGRVENLKALGFNPTQGDVFEFLRDFKGEVDQVDINPPFGVVRNENGEPTMFPLHGTDKETREIDHAIVLGSLAKMKDGGRAVLIIGGSQAVDKNARRQHYATGDRAAFFTELYAKYGVLDHFTVNGDLYSKQGAGWPVDVILIDGRRPSPIQLPTQQPPRILNSWEEVKNELTRTDAERIKAGQYDPDADRQEIGGSIDGIRGALTPGNRSGGAGGSRKPTGGRGQDGEQPAKPDDSLSGANTDTGVPDGQPGGGAAGVGSQPPAETGDWPGGLPVTGEKPVFHKPYVPVSKGTSFGIETPVNMADPQRQSLERIQREVGMPLDEYVAEKVGYDKGTDLSQYFSAEQLDAIASAIYNVENGGALVLGDQTGIGKGRVAAAMIQYARQQGLIPVFVTKDPKLYSALLADAHDIDRPINPAYTNNDLVMVDPVTNEPIRQKSNKPTLEHIAKTGTLPPETDVLFTLYSQLNADFDPNESQKDRKNKVRQGKTPNDGPRMKALRAIAANALFIMDESHLAAGESIQGRRMMSVIEPAKAYYSSATFAKRAESMPLYYKTNLRLAADNMGALVGVFEQGGVVMQQIANSMLAEDGQYIRRERTFDGVSFRTHINLDTADRDRGLADQYTEGLRELLTVNNKVKDAVESLNEIMVRLGKKLNVPTLQLDSADFASQIHNFVRQYLLAIKAEAGAQQAIQAIKEGMSAVNDKGEPSDGPQKHKVIIAVQNTMESPILDLASRKLPLTFTSLLRRTLDDLRTLRSGKGENATVIHIGRNPAPEFKGWTWEELEKHLIEVVTVPGAEGPITVGRPREKVAMEMFRILANDVFIEAEDLLETLDLGDMPLSPIDYIRQRLEAEGIKTGEITGRSVGIGVDGKLYNRPGNQVSKKGQIATLDQFNNSDTDALIVNGSASTGISAHASERFKRRDPRMMIVLQAHLDINEFMQMLGRIFRSGQVWKPNYMLLQSALPAEMRPAAILGNRMRNLNANTTSNTESQVTDGAEMPDIFNEYGDEVMWRYLSEHQDFARALQMPKLWNETKRGTELKTLAEMKETFEEEGKMSRSVTSYASVLPWEDTEMMWNKVLSDYKSLISYLDNIGENTLRTNVEDLGAETISTKVFTEGKEGAKSVFAAPSTLETVSVKSKKKPLDPEDVLDLAKTAAGKRHEVLADFKAKFNAELASQIAKRREAAVDKEAFEKNTAKKMRERYSAQYNDIFGAIDMLGRTVSIQTRDGTKIGAVVEVELNEDKILTPSEQHVIVAVNTIRQKLKIPSSQSGRMKVIDQEDFTPQYQATREDKVPRRIVTGNLVAASARLNGQGKVVQYSRADGSTNTGILLPLDFKAKAERVMVQNYGDAVEALNAGKKLTNEAGTALVRKIPSGEIQFITFASKAKGGKFWQDRMLNQVMENGHFEQRGSNMVGKVNKLDVVIIQMARLDEPLGYEKDAAEDDVNLGASNPLNDTREEVEAMKAGPKGGKTTVPVGGSVKDGIDGAINLFRKIGNGVWNYLSKAPRITSYKEIKGEWLGSGIKEGSEFTMGHQASDFAARELRKEINKKFSRASQEAINVYREAGGDKSVIKDQLDALKAKGKKRYLPAWEKALNLNPEEIALADEAAEFYSDYAEIGRKTGMLGSLRENYVNHFWNLAKLGPKKTEAVKQWSNLVMSRLKTQFDNAKARRFGSSFDGIMEGFDPHTLAVGDLMAIYGQTFNHVLADRAFIKRLIRDVKGDDGRPSVATTGYAKKIQGSAGDAGVYVMPHAKTKVKVTDEAGELIGEADSNDYIAIDHPALTKAKYVGTDTDGNPIILEGDLLVHPQFAKDLKNSLSRSALSDTPVVKQMRAMNNFVKRTILSLSTFHAVTEGLHAIAHGVDPRLSKLPKLDLNDPEVAELVNSGLMLAGNWNAKQAHMEGLSGGGLFERIPGIGPALQWWNEWLFEDYIPRLKQAMALKAMKRNVKRFPNLSRRQVAEITANQSNSAFGELNYRYNGENPTGQDVARMTAFAWDFLRARAQFAGQAFQKYGTEQRKALFLMAVGMFVLCKLIERILTGENHFDKPFYVVDGNRMYGFRTVPGDMIDAVTDPRRFINGRLSPLIARPIIESLTGRDYRGVKVTPGEQLAGMIKGMAPIPLKGIVDEKADVGTVGNILNASGIHTKRYSDLTETRKLARDWQIKVGKTNPSDSFPPSKYLPLKQALEDGDTSKIMDQLRELVKLQGKKKTREGVESSITRPFSGSKESEPAFLRSLDAADKAMYHRADAKRRQMLQLFDRSLLLVPETYVPTIDPSLEFSGFN